MKTILHMIETGGTGGAESVYVNLVRRLDAQRWRHIPVIPRRGWIYDQLTQSNIEPFLVAEKRSLDFAYFRRMLDLLRKFDVDLIHAHLFGSAVRAALIGKLTRTPAVATLHGQMDLGGGERFRGAKISLMNVGLRKIVFVSEPLRQTFLNTVPIRPELAAVIPNGIEVDRFAVVRREFDPGAVARGEGGRIEGDGGRAFRAEFGIDSSEFVVGTVASPGRPAKGLDVLLDVADILRRDAQGMRVVLVGDLEGGRGEQFLEQRAGRGLTRDVVVTGFRSDVTNALAAFDAYALTSRSEGFSISLIEAMASGLPVVATRCGGPEEILTDTVTGILVENGSAPAIAANLLRLRADAGERRRLGRAAREDVMRRFTLSAQINAYEKLYEQVLGISPSAGAPQ
jgi:glycosyltransferase involved in cell wall biosynthesis